MSLRRRLLPTLALAATTAIAGCGGGSSSSTATSASAAPATASSAASATPAAKGAQKVEIKNFDYSPRTLAVSAGTKVSWTNEDTANHTVTFDDGSKDGSKDLGNVQKGRTVSFTFKKPGTYKYHCDYHPNMHGTVVVK